MTRKSKKNTFRALFLFVVLFVLFAAGFTAIAVKFGVQPAPATGGALQTTTAKITPKNTFKNSYTIPTRLVIPKITVDTTVEQMGLTASGDMEAPKSIDTVGWYKYGPRPGNAGSAVIAGHFGTKRPGVFKNLGLLVAGDTISVTDNSKQTTTFIVTKSSRYHNEDAPSEVFTSAAGKHLNLITCDGSWDPILKTYSQRLVVFADKVD